MPKHPRRPGLFKPLLQLGAAAVLGVAARDRLAAADEQARKLIYGSRVRAFDEVVPTVTDLGSVYAVGGAAATLWAFKRGRLARDVVVAGMAAWTLAQGSKRLYGRARPYEANDLVLHVRTPAGSSYPSGHPAVAAAMDRVLSEQVRPPARGLIAKMPRVVAWSRVYVGAHYPTDVIGGLLIGRAVGDLVRRYSR